jgi:hypothetical protein
MTEVQKENPSVVEQASCLLMTEVQKENSSVVEQASCLFHNRGAKRKSLCCGTSILPVPDAFSQGFLTPGGPNRSRR